MDALAWYEAVVDELARRLTALDIAFTTGRHNTHTCFRTVAGHAAFHYPHRPEMMNARTRIVAVWNDARAVAVFPRFQHDERIRIAVAGRSPTDVADAIMAALERFEYFSLSPPLK